MPFEEFTRPHALTLEGRQALRVTGVEEVESFDEAAVVLVTQQGLLVVRGEGLHIEALSLEGGELKLTGQIDSLCYEQAERPGGLLRRLLRP